MMGAEGLTQVSIFAILNANYVAARLDPHYPVLYKGTHGYIAHECILDLRAFRKSAGIEVELDFGIGKDHRTDIPSLHDNAAAPGHISLKNGLSPLVLNQP
jgi:hypothetical protein